MRRERYWTRIARIAHFAASILTSLWMHSAHATTELYIAAQEASEPKFVLRRENGSTVVDGLCVDIMRAIERIEPEFRFVIAPEPQSLARLEAGLATGKLHAACGFLRTRERERTLQFVEPPVFSPNFYVAVRADDDVDVRNWEDIRRLGDDGVILGTYACIKVLQGISGLKLDFSAKDPKTNIQKLLAGRGRFFLYPSPGIEDAIRDAGAQDKVKILPSVMDNKPLYMVLSHTVPAAASEKVRKAIARLEAGGELKKLFNKWRND